MPHEGALQDVRFLSPVAAIQTPSLLMTPALRFAFPLALTSVLITAGCPPAATTDPASTSAATELPATTTTPDEDTATVPTAPTSDSPTTSPTTTATTPATTSTDATTTASTDSASTDSASTDSATTDATTTDDTATGDCQLADIFSQADWDTMFLHKDDPACFGGVYSYPGLIEAAAAYPAFGCTGNDLTRRREVAAFLAQISHETTGGWAQAPDGPYAWGLCFHEEVGCGDNNCPQYCDPNNVQYPCTLGKTYHGRGAIQLSWNYNYGQAGDALGVALLDTPELVATDSKLAIQTALWFWMTEQDPKPSSHAVMVGTWEPSAVDIALGRLPGFGMTTNIINGGIECGMPTTAAVEDRVGFFGRYTEILATDAGDALYCDQMSPYG